MRDSLHRDRCPRRRVRCRQHRRRLSWDATVPSAFEPEKGLNQGVVEQIAWRKGEPEWMKEMRIRSFRLFDKKPDADTHLTLPTSYSV